jgi:esterase/lipase
MIDYQLPDGTPWRLVKPSKSDGRWCVLWLQGFTSTIGDHTEGVIRMAETTSTTHALLNYAGHGDHSTKLDNATRKQQLDEVVAVYDELAKLGYTKIMASGGSFGAYMAALLSGQRKLESLTLRAPAYYPDEEFDAPYKNTISKTRRRDRDFYKDIVEKNTTNHAVEAVRNYGGCVFVIEHSKDEVIHPSIPQAYFSAAKCGSYIVIPGAHHSPKTMSNPQHYYDLIEMWLKTIVNATKHKGQDNK